MTKYVDYMSRSNFTNQRLFFDNRDGHLLTGDDQGRLLLFDIAQKKCVVEQKMDCIVNDVKFCAPREALICLGKRQLGIEWKSGRNNEELKQLKSEFRDELELTEDFPIVDPSYRKFFPMKKKKSFMLVQKVEFDLEKLKFKVEELSF